MPRPSATVPCLTLIATIWLAAAEPAPAQTPDTPALDAQEQADLDVLAALQRAVLRARDRVFPALVNVEPIIEDYAGGKKIKQRATGSGVIIDAEGHVITNYHVAGKAKLLYCTLSDKQRVPARTIGSDPQTDIAVIKIDLEEVEGELHTATLGTSSTLKVGEYVMAMGSPLALARSLTLGVVSNVERVMGVEEDMEIEAGQKTGMFNLWIQTDAAINPGNSGGPLVNMRGQVVGINTRGAMLANNLGFSVPIDIVKDVVAQILEKGEVTRSWTGLKLQPVIRERGDAPPEGVLVAGIVESSPAARSGVRPGDIVKSVDGKEVSAEFVEELPRVLNALANLEVGKAVEVKIERDGEELDLTMITQALEDFLGEEREIEEWGVTVRSITDHMRRERRLDSSEGVLVTGTAAGKAFSRARPPIARNDVLREIAGSPISSLADLEEVSTRLIEAREEKLLIKYNRARTRGLSVVEISFDDDDESSTDEDPETPVEEEESESESE